MAISNATLTALLVIIAASSTAGHPLPSRENHASLATRIFWPWTTRPSEDCTGAMAGRPDCLAVDLWALGWVLLLTAGSAALLVLYHAATECCLRRADLRRKAYWALRNSACCGGCVRRTGCGKEYEYEEI